MGVMFSPRALSVARALTGNLVLGLISAGPHLRMP